MPYRSAPVRRARFRRSCLLPVSILVTAVLLTACSSSSTKPAPAAASAVASSTTRSTVPASGTTTAPPATAAQPSSASARQAGGNSTNTVKVAAHAGDPLQNCSAIPLAQATALAGVRGQPIAEQTGDLSVCTWLNISGQDGSDGSAPTRILSISATCAPSRTLDQYVQTVKQISAGWMSLPAGDIGDQAIWATSPPFGQLQQPGYLLAFTQNGCQVTILAMTDVFGQTDQTVVRANFTALGKGIVAQLA